MRARATNHPSPVRGMTNVHDTGCGKRKRSDAKEVTTATSRAAPVEYISTEL